MLMKQTNKIVSSVLGVPLIISASTVSLLVTKRTDEKTTTTIGELLNIHCKYIKANRQITAIFAKLA